MSEVKDKNERKQLVTYKGTAIRKPVDFFFSRKFPEQKGGTQYTQNAKKKKKNQPGIFYLAKLSSKIDGEAKRFPVEEKLKEFITTKQAF